MAGTSPAMTSNFDASDYDDVIAIRGVTIPYSAAALNKSFFRLLV
jgi:hypothetical protein